MEAFTTHRGLVAPLDRANVDTDQIIPKQFLKSIGRVGFGANLFDAWRYLDEGAIGKAPDARSPNPGFVLNEPRHQGASLLLTRDNFGCGSSREHAVWALMEYGFRAIIAPSFADIFLTNSIHNGLLPIALPAAQVEDLFARTAKGPLWLTVDLRDQAIRVDDGPSWGFDIGAEMRERLLRGLDDIGLTLAHADAIRAFERRRRAEAPWVFRA